MELLTLLKAIDIGKVQENTDITDIVYDSRKVIPGCVFVCLRGSAVDGHKFAQAACEQGAAAIICEEPVETNCQSYVVGNTKKALALLSAEFFGNPAENGLKIIGITGTKGKTTTAHMIREILECAGHKTGRRFSVDHSDTFHHAVRGSLSTLLSVAHLELQCSKRL